LTDFRKLKLTHKEIQNLIVNLSSSRVVSLVILGD
jgi:hypothetical protein